MRLRKDHVPRFFRIRQCGKPLFPRPATDNSSIAIGRKVERGLQACTEAVDAGRSKRSGRNHFLDVGESYPFARASRTLLPHEIVAPGPQIVERVNRFFGYPAVVRLQVVAGPAPKLEPARAAEPILSPESLQEVERNVADVSNPELRSALARLGAAVRRRHAVDDAP